MVFRRGRQFLITLTGFILVSVASFSEVRSATITFIPNDSFIDIGVGPLAANSPAGSFSVNHGDFDNDQMVEFTTIFTAGTPASSFLRSPGPDIYTQGDSLVLNVENNDESTWSFRLWAQGFRGDIFVGDSVELGSNQASEISLLFDLTDLVPPLPGDPPIDIGSDLIHFVFLEVISPSTPILNPGSNADFTAEYSLGPALTPVPVPAALPLFVTTLVFLGFYGRRRKTLAEAP